MNLQKHDNLFGVRIGHKPGTLCTGKEIFHYLVCLLDGSHTKIKDS